MTSGFTWLDFSERERRQALDVLDLFREQDTRDELGIGTVRDALADLLFPGTSTIQTRARYFLFIPWIYLDLERRRVRTDAVAKAARSDEIKLIYALDASSDRQGIIGVEARDKLKRLPSSVYWQGLGRWGIRLFPGSQDQYHRSLDGFYRRALQQEDEEEPEPGNWHRGLPPRPEGFPRSATFQLSTGEAAYLRDRIMAACSGSLFAHLIDNEAGSDPDAGFPWEHRLAPKLPPRLATQLAHAHNFSQVMNGAALLYNLMLAELERSQLVPAYWERLQTWHAQLAARAGELAGWNRIRFWELLGSQGARIPLQTRTFVESWAERTIGGLAASETADDLIRDGRVRTQMVARESALKGPLARLTSKHARELWQGESGTAPLSFRWPTARAFIADIHAGLYGGVGHA